MQGAGLEPLPEVLKYDLEPLPSSLTPLERMERGMHLRMETLVGCWCMSTPLT